MLTGGGGADTFVFNGGTDVVKDFSLKADHLVIDKALLASSMSVTDLFAAFATVSGSTVHIDLGGGNDIWLEGITNLATLAAHTDIV